MPSSTSLVVRAAPLSLLLAAALYACSDDSTGGPLQIAPDSAAPDATTPAQDAGPSEDGGPTASMPVTLQFAGRVGAEPFTCGATTYANVGTSAATVTAGDLRFFVHGIKLSKAGGTPVAVTLDDAAPWQGSQVGFIDLEDKTGDCSFGTTATNDTLTGKVPPGSYDTIELEIGVPDALNHVNVELAGAPFVASKMQWSWSSGFIHFGAQVNSNAMVEGDGGLVRAPSFYGHLGSSECAGGNPADGGVSSCARKNRPSVKLTGFDPAQSMIVVDVAKLFESSNVDENTAGTISGCMSGPSDPECAPVFQRLGLDFATGAVDPALTQSVFSVAPRAPK